MKVFVTGAGGQLGRDVIKELELRGHQTACPVHGYDITCTEAVEEMIACEEPDAVIHCAAWTDVDGAEDPANREKVYGINVTGTRNVARAAEAAGAKMVYISTDYVFGGAGTGPWRPDDDGFAPVNYYGETKLEGEEAVKSITGRYFIVRTSWLFGVSGNNFVKTIVRAGRRFDKVRVVDDQTGSPTYTKHLAVLLADMIQTEKYGCYHATGGGDYVTWYGFTREIFRLAGIGTTVEPVTTAEYGLSAAARPEDSRLDNSKLVEAGFGLLPDWKEALKEYLEEECLYGTDKS